MKHLYCLFFLLFSSVTLADREILVPDGPPKFCHLPTVEGETNECGTTTIKREIIGEGVSGFSAGYEIEQNLKRITVSDDYKLKKGEYETEDSKNGDLAYGVVDVGTSVGGMLRSVVKPNTLRLFRNIPSDYQRAYKTMGASSLVREHSVNLSTAEDTYKRISE